MFFARRITYSLKQIGENITTIPKLQSNINLGTLHKGNFVVNSVRHHSTEKTEWDLNYEEIANGDEELVHKLKIIALETEVMRQDGKLVPDNSYLKTKHWRELLTKSSRSARQKYLAYLFKLEKKNESRQAKAEEKRKVYEEFLAKKEEEKATKAELSLEEFASTYGLQHNNIFLRFYDTTINHMYNNRLIKAIQFGQKLVVDLGYHADMTKRENTNTAKQLMLLFADNRFSNDPFDLHFCNANKDSDLYKEFLKFVPVAEESWFPLNIHECSYLDVFPKEQLVYLTPHVREEVKEFDHDAVYIIGGIVDKVNQEPLSLAKAKREGLKMAKLPLDRHLVWGAGSGKSLTINQVGGILLDQKVSGNWEYSLRHVPRRKLYSEESTLRAIDRAYSRNSTNNERTRKPFNGKLRFDKLNYNNASKPIKIQKGEEQKRVNIKDIFNK